MSEEDEDDELGKLKKVSDDIETTMKKLGKASLATGAERFYHANFKAYIQKEGRVQIPKAEMDAADLEPGDLVYIGVRRIEKASEEKEK